MVEAAQPHWLRGTAPITKSGWAKRPWCRRRGRRAAVRRDLPAAEIQDRRGRAAFERRRRPGPRPRPDRHRRKGPPGRFQRLRWRRHGHDPRRTGHVSQPGLGDRLLPARASARRGREGAHHAARLRRPQQPQARPVEVHDRRSRRGVVPGGIAAAGWAGVWSPSGRTSSSITATATAGSGHQRQLAPHALDREAAASAIGKTIR